jgi:hypothetical protein
MHPEDLPFRIVSEDEVIARANNLIVGRAAYETAVRLYPKDQYRDGARIIARSGAEAELTARIACGYDSVELRGAPMKLIIAIGLAALLLGCATAPIRYVKTGGTEEEMQRTIAACKVQAAMIPVNDLVGAGVAIQTRENCMRAQGWKRDPSSCDPMWSLCKDPS